MPMSATSIFSNCIPTSLANPRRWAFLFTFLLALAMPWQGRASDKKDAEGAAHALSVALEKDGFEFRADLWEKDLRPEMGKALRIQLFKGNDYRFCLAVPPDSGVHITATVLDFDGKPVGTIQPVAQGWGLVLSFKPKKTGAYVVAIRQKEDGKPREVPCAVATGWK